MPDENSVTWRGGVNECESSSCPKTRETLCASGLRRLRCNLAWCAHAGWLGGRRALVQALRMPSARARLLRTVHPPTRPAPCWAFFGASALEATPLGQGAILQSCRAAGAPDSAASFASSILQFIAQVIQWAVVFWAKKSLNTTRQQGAGGGEHNCCCPAKCRQGESDPPLHDDAQRPPQPTSHVAPASCDEFGITSSQHILVLLTLCTRAQFCVHY